MAGGVDTEDWQVTAPLPGPLGTPPEVTHEMANSMLAQALTGLQLGAWDCEVAGWLGHWDPAAQAAIASWIARAAQRAGDAGRAEHFGAGDAGELDDGNWAGEAFGSDGDDDPALKGTPR